MGFKCGLVGMPNVGKSSIFNLLTQQKIAADNYPFCTIDPNIAYVEVPDDRLNSLANVNKSKNIINASINNKVKRFIYISTPSIYYNGKDRELVKESDPLPIKFVNNYSKTTYHFAYIYPILHLFLFRV